MKFFLPALLLSFAAPAQAFIFITSSTYGNGQRPVSRAPVWRGRTVNFQVNPNLTAYSGGAGVALDVSSNEFLNAAESAINAWAAACRADLKVTFSGTTSTKKSASDQINTISYDNRATGSNMFASNAIIATSYSAITNSDFFDCDIVVNGDNSGDLSVNPGGAEIDLVSVLTHEVGHCLGLDHPVSVINGGGATCPGAGDYCSDNLFLQESTMVQTGVLPGGGLGDITRRNIDQDDIDGIECLYERGKAFRSGQSCASYHGTNGGAPIEGVINAALGPQAQDPTPRNCNTLGDANTARLSTDNGGTGCIPAAIASDSGPATPRSPYFYFGSVWGFLFVLSVFYSLKKWMRKKKSAAWLGLWILAFAVLTTNPSEAAPLEFDLGYRRVSPKLWNRFSEMNSNAPATWNRSPEKSDLGSLLEPSVSYIPSEYPWGTVGIKLTVTLPENQKTSGTPQGLAAINKETSLWGVRIGPTTRYSFEKVSGLFIDGNLALGYWQANQSITSSGASESKLSAKAYAFEAALALGYEIKPSATTALFAKIGFSYLNSSYFSASSGVGNYYSDLTSGSRIGVAGSTLGTQEDLKLKASAVFVAVGIRFGLEGNSTLSEPVPTATIPEPSPTPSVEEIPPAQEPSPLPSLEPTPEPRVEPVVEPTPEPSPEPTPSPTPSVKPDPEPSVPLQRRRIDLPPMEDLPEPPASLPKPEPTRGVDPVP